MDADGTQAGYDLELTRAIAASVEIPLSPLETNEHIYAALTEGKAEAALLASLTLQTLSVAQIKTYSGRACPVRKLA